MHTGWRLPVHLSLANPGLLFFLFSRNKVYATNYSI